jgi:hypothetical protein
MILRSPQGPAARTRPLHEIERVDGAVDPVAPVQQDRPDVARKDDRVAAHDLHAHIARTRESPSRRKRAGRCRPPNPRSCPCRRCRRTRRYRRRPARRARRSPHHPTAHRRRRRPRAHRRPRRRSSSFAAAVAHQRIGEGRAAQVLDLHQRVARRFAGEALARPEAHEDAARRLCITGRVGPPCPEAGPPRPRPTERRRRHRPRAHRPPRRRSARSPLSPTSVSQRPSRAGSRSHQHIARASPESPSPDQRRTKTPPAASA